MRYTKWLDGVCPRWKGPWLDLGGLHCVLLIGKLVEAELITSASACDVHDALPVLLGVERIRMISDQSSFNEDPNQLIV